jgi:hypothetical protein
LQHGDVAIRIVQIVAVVARGEHEWMPRGRKASSSHRRCDQDKQRSDGDGWPIRCASWRGRCTA